MEKLADAFFHPGCCALCTTSKGPFIDTKVRDPLDRYLYICETCVSIMAAAAGLPSPQTVAALQEQLEGVRAEHETLLANLAAAGRIIEEAETIRQALAYSIERGWVVDPKQLTVRPRQLPGTGKVDWTVPLEMPGQTTVEQQIAEIEAEQAVA